jgi:hypothetical protein
VAISVTAPHARAGIAIYNRKTGEVIEPETSPDPG